MKKNNALTSRERRVKPRFKISIKVRIEASLIGSRHRYDFISEDISESGLLIRHTGRDRVGFNELSIIESWLYPPGRDPIFFYAKFVRFSQETQYLAIRIIDIEREEFEKYRDFIASHASEIVE